MGRQTQQLRIQQLENCFQEISIQISNSHWLRHKISDLIVVTAITIIISITIIAITIM